MEKKGSTALWFIIALIPIVDLYFLWKSAENISGHEKVIKKYELLDHKKPKGSTTLWFVIFFTPAILGFLMAPLIFLGAAGIALMAVLGLIILVIGLYVLWKFAEVVSGHEKTYEKYESLAHKEKKDSTVKWFVIGIIPLVNLYFLWKMAEVISGHEKIYK